MKCIVVQYWQEENAFPKLYPPYHIWANRSVREYPRGEIGSIPVEFTPGLLETAGSSTRTEIKAVSINVLADGTIRLLPPETEETDNQVLVHFDPNSRYFGFKIDNIFYAGNERAVVLDQRKHQCLAVMEAGGQLKITATPKRSLVRRSAVPAECRKYVYLVTWEGKLLAVRPTNGQVSSAPVVRSF